MARGTCAECGRDVAYSSNGRAARHLGTYRQCPGAGVRVVEQARWDNAVVLAAQGFYVQIPDELAGEAPFDWRLHDGAAHGLHPFARGQVSGFKPVCWLCPGDPVELVPAERWR